MNPGVKIIVPENRYMTSMAGEMFYIDENGNRADAGLHADMLDSPEPDALAFALRFDGRKRKNDAAEIMARIVAKRLVEHLERSGFVVMKRPPIGGSAPAWRPD